MSLELLADEARVIVFVSVPGEKCTTAIDRFRIRSCVDIFDFIRSVTYDM